MCVCMCVKYDQGFIYKDLESAFWESTYDNDFNNEKDETETSSQTSAFKDKKGKSTIEKDQKPLKRKLRKLRNWMVVIYIFIFCSFFINLYYIFFLKQ